MLVFGGAATRAQPCSRVSACAACVCICYVWNWFFFSQLFRLFSAARVHTLALAHEIRLPNSSFFFLVVSGRIISSAYTRVAVAIGAAVVMRQHHVHICIIFVLLYCVRTPPDRCSSPAARKSFVLDFCKVQLPVVCWPIDSPDRSI